MGQVFTDVLLKKVIWPTSGRIELWDERVPGFGVRISSTGRKTFILVYRHRGRARRLSLGVYPYLSLADARDKAAVALKAVHLGKDPALVAEAERLTSHEFDQVVDDFVERHCNARNKASTAKETERLLKRHFVTAWGKRDLRDITQMHVSAIVDGLMKAGSPSEANHALGAVKKFFVWCEERNLLALSPCSKLKKPARVHSRSRVLSTDELKAVWKSFETAGYPFGHMGKLLLLTGQRRGEVTQMCWKHLDLTAKVWTIPPELSKNGLEHIVPLSDTALVVLASIPKLSKVRVFPARGNDDNAISGFSKAKREIDALSETSGWTLHDLRRTVATKMAELGVAPHVIERVLNHISGQLGGIAGIYNRFQYLAEKKQGLATWARHIEKLMAPTTSKL